MCERSLRSKGHSHLQAAGQPLPICQGVARGSVTQAEASQPPPRFWPGPPSTSSLLKFGVQGVLLPQPGRGCVSWQEPHLRLLPDPWAPRPPPMGVRVTFSFCCRKQNWGSGLRQPRCSPLMLQWASCWTHAQRARRGWREGTFGLQADTSGKWRGGGVLWRFHVSTQSRHRCSAPSPLPHDGPPAQPAPPPLLGQRGQAGSPSVQTALAPSVSECVLFRGGLENTA